MGDHQMTKRVGFVVLGAVLLLSLSACGKPVLGFVTDTYVNQTDSSQLLEITNKESLKEFMGGRLPIQHGWFTVFSPQGGFNGEYTLTDKIYVLKAKDRELKVVVQKDETLRDENGNNWQHQSRSRYFRPPDFTNQPLTVEKATSKS